MPLLTPLAAGLWLALSHGREAGRGEVQLRGSTLVLVLAPAEAPFLELDADGDGRLSVAEVQSQRQRLQARFEREVAVTTAGGRRARLTFRDVSVPTPPRPLEGPQRSLHFTRAPGLRWAPGRSEADAGLHPGRSAVAGGRGAPSAPVTPRGG